MCQICCGQREDALGGAGADPAITRPPCCPRSSWLNRASLVTALKPREGTDGRSSTTKTPGVASRRRAQFAGEMTDWRRQNARHGSRDLALPGEVDGR
jgi:hypothetical protein